VPIVIGLICLYCPRLSPSSVLFVLLLSIPFNLNLIQTTIAAAGHPYLYTGFETGARVRNYLEVGSNLYADYPNATLMTSEIGGLGYSFKGYIVDAAGLASPNAMRFHPMDVPEERSSGDLGAIPVGFIEEIRPDLIISYDIFIESFLRSNAIDDYIHIKKPLFLHQDLAEYGSDSFWSSYYLNVFYQKDFLLSSINNTD